jgi:tetratricopeptide (TPR) repeat protein
MNVAETIFEDDHIRIFYRRGSSEFALATFSNFGFNFQSNKFWGQKFVEAKDLEAYGFVAKKNNWFPQKSIKAALSQGVFRPTKPIITYGHSLGGYAALKYSAALGAASVISGAPQYSINPKIVPTDKRFSGDYDSILNEGMEISAEDLAGNIVIVVDPQYALDELHLSLIRNSCGKAKIDILPVRYIGHGVMDVLVNQNLISNLMTTSITEETLRTCSVEARRLKRRSVSYGFYLARALFKRGKFASALEIIKAVAQQSGLRDTPGALARFHFMTSKILFSLQLQTDGLQSAVDAKASDPNDARLSVWLANCLARLGRWDDAKSELESLLDKGIRSPQLLKVAEAALLATGSRQIVDFDIEFI